MAWIQKIIRLKPRERGFHIVTDEILHEFPEIALIQVGFLHVYIQHTSASLALNENADPTVRTDLESFFRRSVPDDTPFFVHTYEGDDDMPAHVKALMIGASVTVPIRAGRLALGTWQGLYLCEHRNHGGPRNLVVTAHGESQG